MLFRCFTTSQCGKSCCTCSTSASSSGRKINRSVCSVGTIPTNHTAALARPEAAQHLLKLRPVLGELLVRRDEHHIKDGAVVTLHRYQPIAFPRSASLLILQRRSAHQHDRLCARSAHGEVLFPRGRPHAWVRLPQLIDDLVRALVELVVRVVIAVLRL